MQWHKWYLTSISKLLMISACNCKGYPQTHMYIRQQLVPPSLSTASLPYLTHSLWRASGWPENVRACVCVWPQWRPIRVGYGKHRLKSWIMEKLIWSMDQQVTVSMQHTHKNTDTHTLNPFTKLRPCRNSTAIGNNYVPRASTFQWQRLTEYQDFRVLWLKLFIVLSGFDIYLVKIWAPGGNG